MTHPQKKNRCFGVAITLYLCLAGLFVLLFLTEERMGIWPYLLLLCPLIHVILHARKAEE